MTTARGISITRLVNRLLDLPLSDRGLAGEDHFQVLGEAVDADAFALIQIRPAGESARLLSGMGLRTSVPLGGAALKAPMLVDRTINLPDTHAVAAQGPFKEDPFLTAEGARSLLMKKFAFGETYLVIAALKKKEGAFKRGEVEKFNALCGVINLLGCRGHDRKQQDQPKSVDNLTGLGLFAQFHDTLVKELSRARRGGGTVTAGIMSVLAVDPVFKDDALLDVTRTFEGQLRNFDTLVRYGSTELAFVLPDLRSEEGMRVMDRVLGEVVSSLGGEGKAPEIYIGLSCYPQDGATAERLIEMAEAAVNRAVEESRPGVYRWEEKGSGV